MGGRLLTYCGCTSWMPYRSQIEPPYERSSQTCLLSVRSILLYAPKEEILAKLSQSTQREIDMSIAVVCPPFSVTVIEGERKHSLFRHDSFARSCVPSCLNHGVWSCTKMEARAQKSKPDWPTGCLKRKTSRRIFLPTGTYENTPHTTRTPSTRVTEFKCRLFEQVELCGVSFVPAAVTLNHLLS